MNNILQLILLTFFPFLELRGSIPYGILKLNMEWYVVFIIAVLSNALAGIIVFLLIGNIIKLSKKNDFINKLSQKYIERTQNRIKPLVDKYGEFALAIFIGIPLPMTGAYSGALAGYLIGLDFKKFTIANFLGVLIAGIIVTFVVLSGKTMFNIFIKQF